MRKNYDDMYNGEQGELFYSSWSVNVGFKTISEKLGDLIPLEGRCDKSRSANKKLEHFRVAQNLIYDLFNNGLCNRKNHFRAFFGWAPQSESHRYHWTRRDWDRFEEVLEPVFTKIILDAYHEQKELGTV